jgi:phosphatidylglycerophosphate synthase
MITPYDIAKITMTPEKRKDAQNNYFAFYVGRPLSYLLTIPFLYTNITPNTISIISIIPNVIGFILMGIGNNKATLLYGWGCFFLWNLLDGVDGNIARFKKLSSPMGSVYDAMSGYTALVFSFFAFGLAAAHNGGSTSHLLSSELYIVLGALSSIFSLFPRLVMHRALTLLKDSQVAADLMKKSEYGLVKIIALNVMSPSGFVQIVMLLSIIFNAMDIFTLVYCFMNFLIMIVALKNILTKKN